MTKQKTHECPVCHEQFIKYKSTQKVCFSVQCAMKYAEMKAQEKADKEYRRDIKKRKEALKTKSDYEKEAEEACNEYIRMRDHGNNCISCGKPPKKKNAGHYRSVGACSELRYHPFNIHLQCEHCNSWKSGNAIEYRINLIKKIGLKNVEWLEGPHEIQHRSIEDLKEIKAYYKEQTKLLRM